MFSGFRCCIYDEKDNFIREDEISGVIKMIGQY